MLWQSSWWPKSKEAAAERIGKEYSKSKPWKGQLKEVVVVRLSPIAGGSLTGLSVCNFGMV